MRIASLDHLVLTVADTATSTAWYSRVLGMEARQFEGGRVALHFGTQKINLHEVGGAITPKAHAPRPGSADLCFLTETPLREVVAHLAQCGVAVEVGPVTRTGAQGLIVSVYVRDPDGNLVEISNPGGE